MPELLNGSLLGTGALLVHVRHASLGSSFLSGVLCAKFKIGNLKLKIVLSLDRVKVVGENWGPNRKIARGPKILNPPLLILIVINLDLCC